MLHCPARVFAGWSTQSGCVNRFIVVDKEVQNPSSLSAKSTNVVHELCTLARAGAGAAVKAVVVVTGDSITHIDNVSVYINVNDCLMSLSTILNCRS